MNVIVFASRKGGSGKSTLAAHLAAQHQATKPCLLVDADPQGSLTLWHKLRGTNEPPIKTAVNSVGGIIAAAKRDGMNGCSSTRRRTSRPWSTTPSGTPPWWSFRRGPACSTSTRCRKPSRCAARRASPMRWCSTARRRAATRLESPIVTIAREALAKFRAPVWGGQITNRADLLMALSHGEGAREYYAEGRAADEIAGCGRRSNAR